MIRKNAVTALILTAALALVAGPPALAQTKRPPKPTARQSSKLGFGTPESLSGTIQMVVTDQNLLVVSGPNNVPYDLKITPKTVIVVGDKAGTIQSLVGEKGKSVSVGFVPRRDGNFATRVEVAG